MRVRQLDTRWESSVCTCGGRGWVRGVTGMDWELQSGMGVTKCAGRYMVVWESGTDV